MIEVPAYPGDGWQPVVCRLCRHSFAVLIPDPATELPEICQACALFVEVLGQPPVLPVRAAPPAPLGALWTSWWSRWRESQEEMPPPGHPHLPIPEAESGG